MEECDIEIPKMQIVVQDSSHELTYRVPISSIVIVITKNFEFGHVFFKSHFLKESGRCINEILSISKKKLFSHILIPSKKKNFKSLCDDLWILNCGCLKISPWPNKTWKK